VKKSVIVTLIGIVVVGVLTWLGMNKQGTRGMLSSINERILTVLKVGHKEKIIEIGEFRDACLSPDGSKIALTDDQGLWVIHIKRRYRE